MLRLRTWALRIAVPAALVIASVGGEAAFKW
jgi:hypothetical protein